MTNLRLIPALMLTAAAVALPAVAAAGRNPITPQQIAAAMAGAGMEISPRQVTLLTDVVATTAAPVLKVQSMEPWGNHRMMVRMNCAAPEQCLPFFVAVRFNQGDEVRPIGEDADQPATPNRPVAPAVPLLRVGAVATLLLDGDHIHIQLPVVSLENGAAGQTIRVTSKDRKLVYLAQVVDGTLLRGKL